MKINTDILHYRKNEGAGSTITRDLILKLFRELSKNIKDEAFCEFVKKSRVPNERELYGLFVRSLLTACGEDLGHIATEFQVERGDYNDGNPKGRVDMLFDYRSVSYLVELKAGRINARGEDREPKIKARKSWNEGVNQLINLNADSVSGLLRNKVVKLPIALYFYDSQKNIDEDEINYEKLHDSIYTFLSEDEESAPDFDWYSSVGLIPTRLRKTNMGETENNFIYGFSIFAKQISQ